MTDTIFNKISDYLISLNATHNICSELGTAFTTNNLFIGYEPNTKNDSLTLIPYGGGPPGMDEKQNPSVQIRLKVSTRQKALKVQQAIINDLHCNELSGNGKMFAVQSAPILMPDMEGGEWKVSVSNFNIKHVKIED